MKWISLIIGALIIISGVWILMKPGNADGPADTQNEDIMMEGEVMEDGTLDSSAAGTQHTSNPSTEMDTNGEVPPFAEEEPMGDPIFHALVEYTDDGFVPKTVTINKGETVRFVNNSSKKVWVGGDNHPTHTNYPEKTPDDCLGTSFDTCRSLVTAEFWEFTFNEVGEWGYHNHVRSSHGGTVIVK